MKINHPLPSGDPSLVKEGIEKIRDYLEANALDAFLVMTKINRQYLSGFTGSAGVVLVTPSSSPPIHKVNRGRINAPQPPLKLRGGAGELFVDERYTLRARRESPLAVKKLADLARVLRGLKKIGIEDRITLRELKWLKKMGGKFAVTSDIIENLRAVKSSQEIGFIKKAQTVIDKIFTIVKKSTIPGMTELQLAQKLERLAHGAGASGLAFEPIVAWGANAAAPHHLSGKQKIGRNNFLLMDFGVLVGGYHSDFTRTLFLGRPNKKQEQVYETVREAQQKGIAALRVGTSASEVDAAAREYITERGFGKYFTHNTGHGVGLEIHELPNFSAASEDILRENMVVTVEPGIYIEKWGGVRIEDMVVVGQRGAEVLSKVPKDLKRMIIK